MLPDLLGMLLGGSIRIVFPPPLSMTSSSMSSASFASKELNIEVGGATNMAADDDEDDADDDERPAGAAPFAAAFDFLGFLGVVDGAALVLELLLTLGTGTIDGGGMGSGVSLGACSMSLSSSSSS